MYQEAANSSISLSTDGVQQDDEEKLPRAVLEKDLSRRETRYTNETMS